MCIFIDDIFAVLLLTGHNEIKKEYLRNIKTIHSGAAPLAASDEERFNLKFGNHIKTLQGRYSFNI